MLEKRIYDLFFFSGKNGNIRSKLRQPPPLKICSRTPMQARRRSLKRAGLEKKEGTLKNSKKVIYSVRYLKKGTNIGKIEKKGSSRIEIQCEMGQSRNAQRKKISV